MMPNVFISYVHENEETVIRICDDLRVHGIHVWRDSEEIKPGARWEDVIRGAIAAGDFFIACFSEEYNKRSKTYMNKELRFAIKEMYEHPVNRIWFIPVMLSECDLPEFNIGGGETIRSFQCVELYKDWESGIRRILTVIISQEKERRKQIRKKILELGLNESIPDSVLLGAIELLSLDCPAMSEAEKNYSALLDRLAREDIGLGDFVTEWLKIPVYEHTANIKKFSNRQHTISYIMKRIKESKNYVHDLSLQKYDGKSETIFPTSDHYEEYLLTVEEVTKRNQFNYFEIIEIANLYVLKKVERLIAGTCPGYHLAVYPTVDGSPPVWTFVIIDKEEVIFLNGNISVKQPDIVNHFLLYYEDLFKSASIVKSGERTLFENILLKEAQRKFKTTYH